MVAGMVRTAVVTRTALQRARGEVKHTAASIQQERIVAKRLTTYQASTVQSIGMCVSFDVQANKGLNSDKWPWERKNSVAYGYRSGWRSFLAEGT